MNFKQKNEPKVIYEDRYEPFDIHGKPFPMKIYDLTIPDHRKVLREAIDNGRRETATFNFNFKNNYGHAIEIDSGRIAIYSTFHSKQLTKKVRSYYFFGNISSEKFFNQLPNHQKEEAIHFMDLILKGDE